MRRVLISILFVVLTLVRPSLQSPSGVSEPAVPGQFALEPAGDLIRAADGAAADGAVADPLLEHAPTSSSALKASAPRRLSVDILDGRLDEGVVYGDLKLQLRQQLRLVLSAAVQLGVAALSAAAAC